MTKTQLTNLRGRMLRHTEVCDIAVCVLTARELQELLDLAEKALAKPTRKPKAKAK